MMAAAPVIEVGLMTVELQMLMMTTTAEAAMIETAVSVEATTRRAPQVISQRSSANRLEYKSAIFLEASHSICSEPVKSKSISCGLHFVVATKKPKSEKRKIKRNRRRNQMKTIKIEEKNANIRNCCLVNYVEPVVYPDWTLRLSRLSLVVVLSRPSKRAFDY